MGDTVAHAKKKLRQEAKAAVAALPAAQRAAANAAILCSILTLPEYANAKLLFCYVSTPEEVDTHMLIRYALGSGKRVAVPRCVGNGIMELREITSLAQLEPAPFGLLEPGPGAPMVQPTEVDFAIVPCASCDVACRRLGKGGGYYDRVLAQGHFATAALVYAQALCVAVPCEAHDVDVDMVITENRIYRKGE